MPSEKVVVISFFCHGQKDNPRDILRSLILQLIDCEELFKYLPLYLQEFSVFNAASFSTLWSVFMDLVHHSQNQRLYCIIDAIDECVYVENERANLLEQLDKRFCLKNPQRKLLVTSRHEPDLVNCLQHVPNISLQARSEDLSLYVRSEIDKLPNKELLNDEMRDEIRDTLITQAGRTYLWASLIIKQIRELESPTLHDVELILKRIPEGLNALYSKLADRLLRDPVFAKLLIWVAYAKR